MRRTGAGIVIDKDVPVMMSDGVILRLNVFRPLCCALRGPVR